MSRTLRYKIVYGALIVVGAIAAVSILTVFHHSLTAFGIIVILLLLPGRIQGHYWRDFFRARRLMAERRCREAEPIFRGFLERVRARPELKRFIWLGYSVYTRDIAAMTLNNTGVCALEDGRLEAAESYFNEALQLDTDYPVPYFNLAIVYSAMKRPDDTTPMWSRSQELGYRRTSIDLALHKAAEILARVEGHRVYQGGAA